VIDVLREFAEDERAAPGCDVDAHLVAMVAEIVIDKPWQRIVGVLRRQEGRTIAAIAYMTKRLLDLRSGDALVCDASVNSVKAGRTDPRVLLEYVQKGVRVWDYPGLHAKAIVRGRVAIVGSANSSNVSADGRLTELIAIFKDPAAVIETREGIEAFARRSTALDPVTLERRAPLFNPGREFLAKRKTLGPRRSAVKTRAWCIATHYINEHSEIEKARQRGTKRAKRSAQDLLGRRWRQSHRIDDYLSWPPSTVREFELEDCIFEVLEQKTLKPPGVLVHVESTGQRHGSVLFICRERKLHSRQMKNLRKRLDRKTYALLRKAYMRRLTVEQRGMLYQIFGS
jgi:hypothetical protein